MCLPVNLVTQLFKLWMHALIPSIRVSFPIVREPSPEGDKVLASNSQLGILKTSDNTRQGSATSVRSSKSIGEKGFALLITSLISYYLSMSWRVLNFKFMLYFSLTTTSSVFVRVTWSRQWVGCRENWCGVISWERVTNSYVLHCLGTSKNCPYLCNQMSDWDEVWIKM